MTSANLLVRSSITSYLKLVMTETYLQNYYSFIHARKIVGSIKIVGFKIVGFKRCTILKWWQQQLFRAGFSCQKLQRMFGLVLRHVRLFSAELCQLFNAMLRYFLVKAGNDCNLTSEQLPFLFSPRNSRFQ